MIKKFSDEDLYESKNTNTIHLGKSHDQRTQIIQINKL